MTFILINAKGGIEEKIEISSLEDLQKIISDYNHPIIIYPPYYSDEQCIKIYDDYIEKG